MSRPGPETRLVKKMREAGKKKYGKRLVTIKYHGDEYGEAGVADLLNTIDGLFVAVEVKSPESSEHKRATLEASIKHALEKGPTLKQRAFGQRVIEAGGVWAVCATVEQYMEVLWNAACKRRGPEYESLQTFNTGYRDDPELQPKRPVFEDEDDEDDDSDEEKWNNEEYGNWG